MQHRPSFSASCFSLLTILILSACSSFVPFAASTDTPSPTATIAMTATITPRPSFTLRPTQTPYLTGTALAEIAKAETQTYLDELKQETQRYYDLGYLTSTDGKYRNYRSFSEEWAQLNWYQWWILDDQAGDFYLSAHFKWSSAYRNADISGCGFVFAVQENGDHYAVFLDRSRIEFLSADQSTYPRRVGTTRGTDRVNFGNPADQPVEADFTLIVKGTYAYVLVDDELVAEYTLSQSKALDGNIGLTLLSGTNKDYGTRCNMTNLHAWIAK